MSPATVHRSSRRSNISIRAGIRSLQRLGKVPTDFPFSSHMSDLYQTLEFTDNSKHGFYR